MKSPRGLFITGTDTGVGKTYVTCCIAKTLVAQGVCVGVYKPVASGCQLIDNELISDDAVAIWEAAGKPVTLNAVCPQRFAAPLAPHLAARAEGRQVDETLLRQGLQVWSETSDFLLVEGAGGLLSPLGDDDYVAKLAHDLGFPLLIVAPNQIGVINQTLQTLVTASAYREGLPVAGIVLNAVKPADVSQDPSILSNRQELERRIGELVLAELAYQGETFDRSVDWKGLVGTIPAKIRSLISSSAMQKSLR